MDFVFLFYIILFFAARLYHGSWTYGERKVVTISRKITWAGVFWSRGHALLLWSEHVNGLGPLVAS